MPSDWYRWNHDWWSHEPHPPGSAEYYHSLAYHNFNLLEGFAWLLVAAFVLHRFTRRGKSRIEILYAVLFVTFAWTDFREAHSLPNWLIVVKTVNLLSLLAIRRFVIREIHPGSRLC